MIPRHLPACVLDASAVLAFLFAETGATIVLAAMRGAVVSSVNWAEIVQQAQQRSIATDTLRDELFALGLEGLPFRHDDAEQAAAMWPATRALGLSLGDRACLSLASRLGLVVLTADRSWTGLQLGIEVRSIR